MGRITFTDPAMGTEFDSGASLEDLRSRHGSGKIRIEHTPKDIEEMGTDDPDLDDVDALVASRRAAGPTPQAPPAQQPPGQRGAEQVYTQPKSWWSKPTEALPGIKIPGSAKILSQDWDTARARAQQETTAAGTEQFDTAGFLGTIEQAVSPREIEVKKPVDIERESKVTPGTWLTRNLPLSLYRAGKGVLELPAMAAGGVGVPLAQWATERDPVKQQAIAEKFKKSAEETASALAQPYAHPWDTLVDDPVGFGLAWTAPLQLASGGAGLAGRAAGAGRVGSALTKAAPILSRAAGEVASAAPRTLASLTPHVPGSYPYRAAQLLASRPGTPAPLKAVARAIMKPSDIIGTMPSKIQEIIGKGPQGPERGAALTAARSILAEKGELPSPISGQMVPAPQAIAEAAHLVPEALKARFVEEAAKGAPEKATGAQAMRAQLLADPTKGAAAIETLESRGIRALGEEGTPAFKYEAIPQPPPPPPEVRIVAGQGVKADPRLVDAMNKHLAPLRQNIDAVTKELIDLGYAGADSAEILGPRLGSFLKRIYDEKVIKEKFPQVWQKWQAEKKINAQRPAAERLDQNHLMRRVWGDLPYQTLREFGLTDDFAKIGYETVNDLATLRDRLRLTAEMKAYNDTLDPSVKTVLLPKEATTRGFPRYGQMAGEATTPEVASALRAFSDLMGDVMEPKTPIGKAWQATMGLWKQSMLSPLLAWATYMRNSLSFVVAQSEMAGNPVLSGKGLMAWKKVQSQWRRGHGPDIDEFAMSGGMGQGLAPGELNLVAGKFHPVPTVGEWLKRIPEMIKGDGDGGRLGAVKNFFLDDPMRSYGAADDFFRNIQFTMVRDLQREYAMAPAAKRVGLVRDLTRQWGQDAERILNGGTTTAMEMAHKATLNYSDVSRATQGISRTVSPFHKFSVLSQEQIINWFQQHPLKVMLLRTADDFYNRMYSRFVLEMEPDELKRQLAALPPYMEAAMPITKTKDGKLKVVGLGYVLPFGSYGTPKRHYQGGLPSLESAYFANPLARPAVMALSGVAGGPVYDPFRQRDVLPASAALGEKLGAVGKVLGQQFTPPVFRAANKAYDAATGQKSPYTGEVPSLKTTVLGYATGLKPDDVTPARQRQMAQGEFERAINEQKRLKSALRHEKGLNAKKRLARVREINARIREIQDEQRIRQQQGQ